MIYFSWWDYEMRGPVFRTTGSDRWINSVERGEGEGSRGIWMCMNICAMAWWIRRARAWQSLQCVQVHIESALFTANVPTPFLSERPLGNGGVCNICVGVVCSDGIAM
ncbi:hypothetical protein PISMIDRAFT_564459 [Pisolithus microcarpus 441]|uniref:Uncharacterized protein n=1 Tax=Pisolithus microcarpus 441 TaxID=765257 RepID=A0A0C9Y8V5_9AGAM|nr:hypothetical protein PISMIDRAFT_564459 [Pisolithus microcarpus 441]